MRKITLSMINIYYENGIKLKMIMIDKMKVNDSIIIIVHFKMYIFHLRQKYYAWS